MERQRQVELAEHFRSLHHSGEVLLLPNAWDAASARLFTDLGFGAIATTSGGIAWSLGHPDDVAASVCALIDTGAVGINLEDGIAHTHLRETSDAAARVAAARVAADESGIPIVINARVDTWIVGGETSTEQRIEETVRRGRAYLDAGADCIYPIALADPAAIATVCEHLDAPVNIGARVGLPNLAKLGALGVTRVSLGTRLASIALGAARDAASAILDTGAFDTLATTFTHEDAQRLFGH